MAFESVEIRQTKNLGYTQIGIFNPIYAEPAPDIPTGKPVTGRILPPKEGFPYKMERPYVDFKTFRAVSSHGLASEALRVVNTKRRSTITEPALYNNLLNFCQPVVGRLDHPAYLEALSELKQQFKIDEKLTPISLKESSQLVPQNTSPGLPYIITDPGLKKGDIIDKYFDRISELWDRVGEGKRNIVLEDSAAFARSHIGAPDTNKVRPVWACPLDVIIAEGMFAFPILEELKSQRIGVNTAYGMEMMKGGMEWLNGQLLKAKQIDPGIKMIMLDYSAFDSSVPAWLIRDCFSIIREKFEFPDKYTANIFRKIESYFINTPVRTSKGRRVLTDHGVPSGSMFTNIIDTMINFLVSRFTVKVCTLTDPIFDIYFGDDALIVTKSKAIINMDDISETVREAFGMTVSTKKSFWTEKIENVHFLGYWNRFGTPYKKTDELLASMLYPQYKMDDWSYTMARALGCLMAAAGANADIFKAVQAVFICSQRHEGACDTALKLIQSNARMKRHLIQMGVSPQSVSYAMLYDKSLSAPQSNCTKIELNINLC